jgi:hypothetical protein
LVFKCYLSNYALGRVFKIYFIIIIIIIIICLVKDGNNLFERGNHVSNVICGMIVENKVCCKKAIEKIYRIVAEGSAT